MRSALKTRKAESGNGSADLSKTAGADGLRAKA